MVGLSKCEEEDFYQFQYSFGRYYPDNLDAFFLVLTIVLFVFWGTALEYYHGSGVDLKNKNIVDNSFIAFVLISILIIQMLRIKDKKYAFKFQKIMILVLAFYWIAFSFCMYPYPLVLASAAHNTAIIGACICGIIISIIYFIVIFIRLIYLIMQGQMRKGCGGLYERLISNKISVGAGVSIPFIVISSKLARNVTKAMDSAGNEIGFMVFILILAFILNIITITFVPELIVLAYCKYRFESFNISDDPKVREIMYKSERRRMRREQNNMQMIKKDNNENSKKNKKRRKKYKKRKLHKK